jgi:ferredoxin
LFALGATSLAAGKLIASSSVAPFSTKNKAKRQVPISPPGSTGHDNLLSKCTSCHLCVSKCPTGIIKPAFTEYGAGGVMQPMLNFEHGFCNYDCSICSVLAP